MTERVPHGAHWGAFEAVVEDGRFVAVAPLSGPDRPDLDRPDRPGYGSSYAASYPAAVHSAVRVTRPAVRRGWLERRDRSARGDDEFVEVGWDQALELVAAELTRLQASDGMESVFAGSYGWSSAGRFHHAKSQLSRFLSCLGGYVGQRGTYSYAAGAEILPYVLGADVIGQPMTSWSVIARHTKVLVAFGGLAWGNLQIEAGGFGRHSGQLGLREVAEAGVDLVAVGPVRPEGPLADKVRWIPIRPQTDVPFMMAMIHVLLTEHLADEEFLRRFTTGHERIVEDVLGHLDGIVKDPAWAARICATEPATIADLARRCAGQRSLVTASWSLQRAEHGEQPFWMIVALASFLGQIGCPGGGFGIGYGSTSGVGSARQKVPVPTFPTLPNPLRDRYIPVARITEMLENPGAAYDFNGTRRHYPGIRLIYWAGGNPFHHHQDLFRLRAAWREPETVIVHEPWWTATARHADIVLPTTTTLERNDIGAASRDRMIRVMARAVEPLGDARSDFDIFRALGRRLGIAERFDEGLDEFGWLRRLWGQFQDRAAQAGTEAPDFDAFWKSGGYWQEETEPVVLLSGFRRGEEPLATPSGRIELFSERIDGFGYDDCPGRPTWLEPQEWLGAPLARRYPLHLVSTQPRHRLHSQLDMGPVSRAAKIDGREAVRVHPDDAAARGLSDGSLVEIRNERGRCLAGLRISPDIMPGVIELSTGAWFEPDPDHERRCLHGNPNVLTRDVGTSRLAQGPSAHSTLVDVRAVTDSEPARPVTVLDRPPPGVTPAAGRQR